MCTKVSGGSRISQTRERQTPKLGVPLFGQIFPKNYMKMKEIRRRGWRASLVTPLDPPFD